MPQIAPHEVWWRHIEPTLSEANDHPKCSLHLIITATEDEFPIVNIIIVRERPIDMGDATAWIRSVENTIPIWIHRHRQFLS